MATTYRNLSLEELKLFHKEFADFLAVNGIDSSYWKTIKNSDIEKTNKILDEFSNVIFNSILFKMEYVEFVTENSAKYFYYGKEKAELIGLESEGVDFANKSSIIDGISKGIKFFKTEKTYSKSREVELFDMLKNGCQPSDGSIFINLKKSL